MTNAKASSVATPPITLGKPEVAAEVAAEHARDVDRRARFPSESFAALREASMLAAGVPSELGGLGLSTVEQVEVAAVLAEACSATGMIWAMHQIQVACIVRHREASDFFGGVLHELNEAQPLLASVTSEASIGGDLRQSNASLSDDGPSPSFSKDAPTVSYGQHADAYLVTLRRSAESAPNDQVLVYVRRDQTELEQKSEWDTLGMRGTCSPGFLISGTVGREQVLPVPFGDIAAQSMVPMSHLLWSACWLGIARAALTTATRYARRETRRRSPEGQALALSRLSEASRQVQLMASELFNCAAEYDALWASGGDDHDRLGSTSFGLRINGIKLSASMLAIDVTSAALRVGGIAGYSETSPYSVARHLRDAHSAPLMINNDRLQMTGGLMMLANRDE